MIFLSKLYVAKETVNSFKAVSGVLARNYQQRYMYCDAYQTRSWRWAGTYEDYSDADEQNKKAKVKPIIIDFSEEVSYLLRIVGEDSQVFTLHYPKPYYRNLKDKAVAVYGNYVEDLSVLKRDGVFTERGLFEDGELQ